MNCSGICAKCKTPTREADLMWVMVKGKMKLLCVVCRDGD